MSILKSGRNAGQEVKLFQFTSGLEVDALLYPEEIRVQKAWARALQMLGVLTPDELAKAKASLGRAGLLMDAGTFPWRVEDEDVHMNLERFVTEECGELGKKIHFGRSRNDLIATTLRLYVARRLSETVALVRTQALALATQAERSVDLLVPGYTHLQHGQPIRLSLFWQAHAEALTRDLRRLEQARLGCLERMPLGAAALAGTPLGINLQLIASELGFRAPTRNAYDAVGDRDFMLEALSALALLGVHLSRFCEDIIFFSSSSVGLMTLPKDWSTGSSIMPNKRNPDVAELTRAKCAHLLGALANGFALMKGLPSSYNGDLHELKGVVIRAFLESEKVLTVLPHFTAGLVANGTVAKSLLGRGHLLATEMADDLVSQGKSFRDAYKQIAAAIESAETEGLQIHEGIDRFTFETAVERRQNAGGTSKASLKASLASLREELGAE